MEGSESCPLLSVSVGRLGLLPELVLLAVAGAPNVNPELPLLVVVSGFEAAGAPNVKPELPLLVVGAPKERPELPLLVAGAPKEKPELLLEAVGAPNVKPELPDLFPEGASDSTLAPGLGVSHAAHFVVSG